MKKKNKKQINERAVIVSRPILALSSKLDHRDIYFDNSPTEDYDDGSFTLYNDDIFEEGSAVKDFIDNVIVPIPSWEDDINQTYNEKRLEKKLGSNKKANINLHESKKKKINHMEMTDDEVFTFDERFDDVLNEFERNFNKYNSIYEQTTVEEYLPESEDDLEECGGNPFEEDETFDECGPNPFEEDETFDECGGPGMKECGPMENWADELDSEYSFDDDDLDDYDEEEEGYIDGMYDLDDVDEFDIDEEDVEDDDDDLVEAYRQYQKNKKKRLSEDTRPDKCPICDTDLDYNESKDLMFCPGCGWNEIDGPWESNYEYIELDEPTYGNRKGFASIKTRIVKKKPATTGLSEVAPQGFESVVKALKKNPSVDNPWAVAWSMKKKGYTVTESLKIAKAMLKETWAGMEDARDDKHFWFEDEPKKPSRFDPDDIDYGYADEDDDFEEVHPPHPFDNITPEEYKQMYMAWKEDPTSELGQKFEEYSQWVDSDENPTNEASYSWDGYNNANDDFFYDDDEDPLKDFDLVDYGLNSHLDVDSYITDEVEDNDLLDNSVTKV